MVSVAQLVIAAHFIMVHAPGGAAIEINPREMSSLRNRAEAEGHFHKDVECVITMSNGKFIAVTETCDQVVRMVEEREPK